ncbi:MAG: hypothetical protein AAGG48_24835 [Planctomycetota bacterium]
MSPSPHTLIDFRLGLPFAETIPKRWTDCFAIDLNGQRFMDLLPTSAPRFPSDVTAWQRFLAARRLGFPPVACNGAKTLRGFVHHMIAGLKLLLLAMACGAPCNAQIYDSLDAHPPRWYLDRSDCDAEAVDQGHLVDGGVAGGACETITLETKHGTEAILVYPIEPVQPLNDLTANVSLMSAKDGARIGFRVRFPYLRDPETRRPVAVIVYGASYTTVGQFGSIGVGAIERPLRLKFVALRKQFGSDIDLSEPYVDGVVINAYSGPGKTTLRIDELRVDGLIPLGEEIALGTRSRAERVAGPGQVRRVSPESTPVLSDASAFPVGTVTRILQHNGEPLFWVRSLGFDAVLLSQPPDAGILREAIRSRVKIYAPPPSSPDPAIESLLDPIAGWFLGLGEAMDSRQVEKFAEQSRRLRKWPLRWQRALIGAPSEAWSQYAPLLDGMIDDLPPRNRGLRGDEEVAQMVETRRRLGEQVETGIGIMSMPPDLMISQVNAIADSIGAPSPDAFRWHAMWIQAMRSLEVAPRAILFRSTRPISSGLPIDDQRSMSLSYTNRMIAMIAPWVASATPSPPPSIVGAPYLSTRLRVGGTEMLVLTTLSGRGNEILAGDGDSIDILLNPADATKTAWRLTHFSAERITPESTTTGARLSIISPDAVEIVVLSSDPTVGGQLARSAERFARQAGLDRWQLAADLVRRTGEHWTTASALRVVQRSSATDLINIAEQTLSQAEPAYRAGDTGTTLRMARRADAWALRSEWQLAEALMPDWPRPVSCPPMDLGSPPVQAMWRTLMDDAGWGRNRLVTGSLDTPDLIGENRWTFGKRMKDRANSELFHIRRGAFQGTGALRARVSPLADDPLPGGYEGTVIQIRSPPIRVKAGQAIRIDAMIRTLGFGAPHQGVLVYDTLGGQEMGVLIRGHANWTPVRLYRQATGESVVHVMFELIGAGEATIDDVRLNVWEPSDSIRPAVQPIAEKTGTEPSTRR